jgi:ketosteroid isomerase-like protein
MTALGCEPSLDDIGARLACEALSVGSYRVVDDGRATAATDLFTDDAVFEAPPQLRLEGKEAIAKAFVAREAATDRVTRHVLTNLAFTRASADAADVHATLVLYRMKGGDDPSALAPRLIAALHDRFRRVDGAWKIAGRCLTVLAGKP